MGRLIDRLKKINPWHFLWIGVILSEVATLVASVIQSYLWWGYVPVKVLVIGAGDALMVPLVVVGITIIFVSEMSRLKQELQTRKESEQQIRYLAYYDSLTKLPNRQFFKELLEHAIAYADRHELTMAVLFLDLDNFKRINDTLGHDKGDKLLRAVTKKLVNLIRNSDYVARADQQAENIMSRLGGDEFILLLQNLIHPKEAYQIASRILSAFSEPFVLEGREIFITTSVGISLYPDDGTTVDELLKNADIAMYHAKSKGRNNCQFYSKSMTYAAEEYLNLKDRLHKAVKNEEFLVYYQPIHSLPDRKLIGVEALLRWKPPDSDLVLPSKFITIAEETGLIIPIGEWVLNAACLQVKAWQEAGYEPIAISVNLSNRQFDQPDLPEAVARALRNANLSSQYLKLEITESALMRDSKSAIATLYKLKRMGIKISIDDFGTGYSSLNHLSQIPLDCLKVDTSFVKNISKSPNDEAIIKAIIVLAHNLNLVVTAEGVETEDQLSFLHNCSCDEIQGFLMSPGLPAGEVSKLFAPRS
jgi:diguanylate cyclase (GGDEF)-like protein